MTDTPPIAISMLSLSRGPKAVFLGLDWSVPAGTATGLLGRNGSGKSTLMHTLLGLVPSALGDCKTLGQDVGRLDDDHLSRIGFVDQHYGLLGWLRVEDQIHYVKLMRPNWDRALEQQLLHDFELLASAHLKVDELSGGARQRLAVLVALCHHPDLILLDEPVSAQDPIFRGIVLTAIRNRVIEDGATVVISSHVLRDIEAVVDRIAVLDGGRITVDEDLDTLKEEHELGLEGLFPLLVDSSSKGGSA